MNNSEGNFSIEFNTRGIRNCNPFNIKRSTYKWLGKIPFNKSTDKIFEQFENMDLGVRAGVLLLRNYIRKNNVVYGRRNTIHKIVLSFAPPCDENDYNGYVKWLEDNTGLKRDDVIVYPSPQFNKICRAIMLYESRYKVPEDYIYVIISKYKLY